MIKQIYKLVRYNLLNRFNHLFWFGKLNWINELGQFVFLFFFRLFDLESYFDLENRSMWLNCGARCDIFFITTTITFEWLYFVFYFTMLLVHEIEYNLWYSRSVMKILFPNQLKEAAAPFWLMLVGLINFLEIRI